MGMDTIAVQPHPIIEDLFSALDTAPGHVDEIVMQLNGLIARTHTYCWVHHEVEAARWGHCIECHHGWDSEAQLIEEDYAVSSALYPNQAVPAYSVDIIFVCPACSHDL